MEINVELRFSRTRWAWLNWIRKVARTLVGFQSDSDDKEPACQCRGHGCYPWVRKIPGGGHGSPLQYPCLENPMDRGAWRATVHGVTKNQIWLKQLSTLAVNTSGCHEHSPTWPQREQWELSILHITESVSSMSSESAGRKMKSEFESWLHCLEAGRPKASFLPSLTLVLYL